ncbi:hypothetical protein TNCV_1261941 [Trichonephila clavipes]|nr:hypothetical protein TNCV_1261941 [Trichonephila clavipes]
MTPQLKLFILNLQATGDEPVIFCQFNEIRTRATDSSPDFIEDPSCEIMGTAAALVQLKVHGVEGLINSVTENISLPLSDVTENIRAPLQSQNPALLRNVEIVGGVRYASTPPCKVRISTPSRTKRQSGVGPPRIMHPPLMREFRGVRYAIRADAG